MLWIDEELGDPPAQEVADNVWVGLAPDGRIAWIELLETNMFGSPFDDAAAARAVAFVEEHLATRPTG
jgi:hypothetical protein